MNSLDQALEQLHDYGCDLTNGLTNHAPMVAEAMHFLGLDDAIEPWVSAELARIQPRPAPTGHPIGANWHAALGGRFADWSKFFTTQIDAIGWHAVLTDWIPNLAPGFSAAAAHGVIRVGHAVRGLQDEQTAARERELADALAAWASTYTTLPTADRAADRGPDTAHEPMQALAAVPLVKPEHRYPQGSITAGLTVLSGYPDFAVAVNAFDRDAPPERNMPALADVFAHLFLQSVDTPLRAIVFTHAITGLAAARNLLGELTQVGACDLLFYAWQTGCALHAVYSARPFSDAASARQERAQPVSVPEASELIVAALDHGDEHVIKLTEACITFHRAYDNPALLAAADHSRRLISPRS